MIDVGGRNVVQRFMITPVVVVGQVLRDVAGAVVTKQPGSMPAEWTGDLRSEVVGFSDGIAGGAQRIPGAEEQRPLRSDSDAGNRAGTAATGSMTAGRARYSSRRGT